MGRTKLARYMIKLTKSCGSNWWVHFCAKKQTCCQSWASGLAKTWECCQSKYSCQTKTQSKYTWSHWDHGLCLSTLDTGNTNWFAAPVEYLHPPASFCNGREPFLEISKTVGHAVMPYIAMLMYICSLSKEAQATCTYLHPHSSLTEVPQAQTAEAERFASVIRLVKASLASCRITLWTHWQPTIHGFFVVLRTPWGYNPKCIRCGRIFH